MKWFYHIAQVAVKIASVFWLKVEYEGLENIPKTKGGFIVVCNHSSYFDPILVAVAIRPMIRFLAKAELRRNKWLGWLFAALGMIPVDRGSGDTGPLERATELYREGYALGIFPEGTRYPIGKPGRPKSGMALIAQMTGADILPVAISYENPKRFRSRAKVSFAPVIPHEKLGIEADSPRSLRRATKMVWDEVLQRLEVRDEA